MLTTLIAGATGRLGGLIACCLPTPGRRVHIPVRIRTNYEKRIGGQAQPRPGNLIDRASPDPACRGIEVMITAAGSLTRSGDDRSAGDERGIRNPIDAALAISVLQFLFISTPGGSPGSRKQPVRAKGETEVYYRTVGWFKPFHTLSDER